MKCSRSEEGAGRIERGGPLGRHFRKVAAKMAGILRRYGWKLGLVIFLYYLVRDTILYILLPMWVARQILGG